MTRRYMVWTIATPTCDTMVGKILKHYRRTHLQLLSNYQSEATCAMMEHDVMESAIRHIISKPYVTSCNKARIRYDSPWSNRHGVKASPAPVFRNPCGWNPSSHPLMPHVGGSLNSLGLLGSFLWVVARPGESVLMAVYRLTRVCILHRRQDKVKKER